MQQQPDTVTHSRISSLLISRRLTRAWVASRYSVRTSNVTGSGRGNPKIFGLNPPFYISKSATVTLLHSIMVRKHVKVVVNFISWSELPYMAMLGPCLVAMNLWMYLLFPEYLSLRTVGYTWVEICSFKRFWCTDKPTIWGYLAKV